ncbi:MAG: hypothetical protein V3W04_07660 [Gammaproteobacteria bacterium]
MTYKNEGYEVIRMAIPKSILSVAQGYFDILHLQNKFEQKNLKSVAGGAVDRYCDALATVIQGSVQQTLEKTTNLTLLPTYNYSRIYPAGTPLLPHTDRPACEISATLTIQNKPNIIWPIFLRNRAEVTIQVDLNPGDMLIYNGMELPHWREPGKVQQTGIFLHWVDANGPHAQQQGDPKRNSSPRNLGALQEKRDKETLAAKAPTFEFK